MTESKRKVPPGFKPGQSGNPAGKAKGTRNHATRLVLALMEDGAKEVTQVIINAARNGDLTAAKMVLERLAPPLRERPISIDLPDTGDAAGVAAAQACIIAAVGAGDLLPGEGAALSGIVEARRKAIETIDLELRIAALEVGRTGGGR